MKSGLRPTKPDHRDFDFLASHKFGGLTPTLPGEFNVDAGLWAPDQNQPQSFAGIPNIPALPEGCTDYTQTDLCIDAEGVLLDPMLLENITHANANGGADIRTALKAAIQVFQRKQYFNIRATGIIDWFDAVRLAIYSAQPEKRSVSVGTPWYPDFGNPKDGILPIPSSFDVRLSVATWHNWKISGWKMIGDQPYLIGKSWQGPQYGDRGFCYISRPLINVLMNISGTGAFTLSEVPPQDITTVSLTIAQNIVSYVLMLLSKLAPASQPAPTQPVSPVAVPSVPTPTIPTAPQKPEPVASTYDWSTPAAVRHSVRVICDEEGLTTEQKNTMCATIQAESGFKLNAMHDNGTSTDWGLCQWNDYYHRSEITPDEAVHNPEKAVRLMCGYWKRGQRQLWVAYENGSYKKYL